MSKILYLSCHSILEFDEVKLLHELGHEVFSPGAYVDPMCPGHNLMRPAIPELTYSPEILQAWHKICAAHPGEDGKDHLTPEFVDLFDIVIVMHLPRWIAKNWTAFNGKRVIWRTIGQSVASTENSLKKFRQHGLEIVRYSPKESTGIPNCIGQDALIRFYKDPVDYGPWNGKNNRVITFAQHMKQRDSACNYTFFEEVTRPFSRHLFGPGNEGQDWTTGQVPYEQLQTEMCNNRVYFYTGTHPASYTLNFMEAWMTGIPIVAVGSKYGNAGYFGGHDLYEIPDLIVNGVNGFCSNDPEKLHEYIETLMNDHAYAEVIGQQGRQYAIKHFGKNTIMASWQAFLGV